MLHVYVWDERVRDITVIRLLALSCMFLMTTLQQLHYITDCLPKHYSQFLLLNQILISMSPVIIIDLSLL